MPVSFLPAQLGGPLSPGRSTSERLAHQLAQQADAARQQQHLQQQQWQQQQQQQQQHAQKTVSEHALKREVEDELVEREVERAQCAAAGSGSSGGLSPRSGLPGRRAVLDLTVCGECGEALSSAQLTRHQRSACLARLVECPVPGCGRRVAAGEVEAHVRGGCRAVARREALAERHAAKSSEHAPGACALCGEEFQDPLDGVERAAHRDEWCPRRPVACPNASCGCAQVVEAERLWEHLDKECRAERHRNALVGRFDAAGEAVPCVQCQQLVAARDMRRHLGSEACPGRKVPCPKGCGAQVRLDGVAAHLGAACPAARHQNELADARRRRQVTLQECPLQCGTAVSEAAALSHLRQHCPHRLVRCECGATVRAKDRAAHGAGDLFYTIHKVPRCIFAVRRDGLAALSIARDRKPELVPCEEGCGETVLLVRMGEHLRQECAKRLVPCKYADVLCDLDGAWLPAGELELHYQTCPGAAQHQRWVANGKRNAQATRECPAGCGERLRKARVATHTKFLCRRRLVPCFLGCGQRVPMDDMELHFNDESCPLGNLRNDLAARAKARKMRRDQETNDAVAAAARAAHDQAQEERQDGDDDDDDDDEQAEEEGQDAVEDEDGGEGEGEAVGDGGSGGGGS